ncbi:MAG: acyl-CoA thioesterase [Myxococcaceae bacterium]|nr:acyl-CoA thioesterase [Myxococcaceae bacterium]
MGIQDDICIMDTTSRHTSSRQAVSRAASSKIPSHAHSVELTVPFHDIDALRVVWHGHYLKYLEIARCELLKQCGLDVMQMVELGYRFMVSDISCRHTNALTYGDRFRVTAWFTETEHRIGIAYEVFNLTTQKRSARAHSTLITVSGEGKLCLSTPAPIFERLPKLERAD